MSSAALVMSYMSYLQVRRNLFLNRLSILLPQKNKSVSTKEQELETLEVYGLEKAAPRRKESGNQRRPPEGAQMQARCWNSVETR